MASDAFKAAFAHAMIYEIGAFFNVNDPETIAGLCETGAQKKKVGYVNIKEDTGGLTKYGVAKNANPEVDVQNLDLAGAMEIYERKYWIAAKCDQLQSPVSIMHFDCAVNMGVGRAAKFLQAAAGVTVDGAIGAKTIAAVDCTDPKVIIERYAAAREARYNAIVAANPSQAKFLKGWLRRNDEVKQYCLGLIA